MLKLINDLFKINPSEQLQQGLGMNIYKWGMNIHRDFFFELNYCSHE